MTSKLSLYGILGALIGGVFVWLVAVSAVNNNMTGVMKTMGIRPASQITSGSTVTVDRHFIEQMIPHHEDAITMAEIALTSAKKNEVQQLAKNIIDSQGKEINQMRAWYREWFGSEVPGDTPVMGQHGMAEQSIMNMGMMGNASDAIRLEQAQDFDRTFLEQMIPHHQMAVMMANMLKNTTQRPEMKKLADDIIAAQTAEIDQMRQWYKNWGFK